jgi:hypothetical protein
MVRAREASQDVHSVLSSRMDLTVVHISGTVQPDVTLLRSAGVRMSAFVTGYGPVAFRREALIPSALNEQFASSSEYGGDHVWRSRTRALAGCHGERGEWTV